MLKHYCGIVLIQEGTQCLLATVYLEFLWALLTDAHKWQRLQRALRRAAPGDAFRRISALHRRTRTHGTREAHGQSCIQRQIQRRHARDVTGTRPRQLSACSPANVHSRRARAGEQRPSEHPSPGGYHQQDVSAGEGWGDACSGPRRLVLTGARLASTGPAATALPSGPGASIGAA